MGDDRARFKIILIRNKQMNIDRNTKTVGITSLGLEHTSLLGSTFKDIAWQKSGIIKPNCSVYTVPQNDECVRVMEERAAQKQVCIRRRIIHSVRSLTNPIILTVVQGHHLHSTCIRTLWISKWNTLPPNRFESNEEIERFAGNTIVLRLD